MGSGSVADLEAENARLRAALARARRSRARRDEILQLVTGTGSTITRLGVARVLARDVAEVVDCRWSVVALPEGDVVRLVHGPAMPTDVADDWPTAPLTASLPITEVVRGERASIELADRAAFAPWPQLAAEAERADVASLVVLAIPPPPGAPDGTAPLGALMVGWDRPHATDDDLRGVLADIVDVAAVALQRTRRTEDDRSIARTLQQLLLPTDVTAPSGIDVAASYRTGTSAAVGGDWYDSVRLDDGRTAFVVGDVVGHDLRAAAEMSQIRHVLSSQLLSTGDVVRALAETDRYLALDDRNTMATALVVVVDADASTAEIASAGNLPPVALAGGTAGPLSCGLGPPLGTNLAGHRATEHALGPGTVVVAFTDGMVERRGESIDAGIRRFCEALSRTPVGADAATVRDTLVDAAHDDELDGDDAAMLVLRRR